MAGSVPHPLPDALVELVAQRFRVIGEPMRIRLLDGLREREQSVGELVEALDASQQNVSKHLGVLHQAGIVRRRKEGNRVLYAIADPSVFALCETVCGGLQQQVAELSQLLGPPAAGAGTGR
jgi:DNA-binding transcriptional ArsR family regulator